MVCFFLLVVFVCGVIFFGGEGEVVKGVSGVCSFVSVVEVAVLGSTVYLLGIELFCGDSIFVFFV